MGAFLGVSLWIALATVVPGLITIAVLFGAALVAEPMWVLADSVTVGNDWIVAAIAVTIMVLTQAIGILFESILVEKKWLGDDAVRVKLAEGIAGPESVDVHLDPYDEYHGLYFLLAELREDEDSQGHLKRACAQFFLTLNAVVSFGIGLSVTLFLVARYYLVQDGQLSWQLLAYGLLLVVCMRLTFVVAKVRFGTMARSLWAARETRSRGSRLATDQEAVGTGQPASAGTAHTAAGVPTGP